MFITRIVLNPNSTYAAKMLRHYYAHTILSTIFPDESDNPRLLFRIEDNPYANDLIILVQSQYRPAADWFVQNPGFALSVVTNPYNPILAVGDCLRFRLLASPVRRSNGKQLKYNRTSEEGTDWLMDHQHGFKVLNVVQSLQAVVTVASTKSPRYAIPAVQFDGVLEVTDPAEMTRAIQNGIGRSRHLGMGMLSLSRR